MIRRKRNYTISTEWLHLRRDFPKNRQGVLQMEVDFPGFILKTARQVISGMICSVSSLAEAAETAGRVMVLEMVKAMEKAGSVEPSKYLPELKTINFEGVTGNVAFDAHGDIKEGAVTVYQFKDGAWVAL